MEPQGKLPQQEHHIPLQSMDSLESTSVKREQDKKKSRFIINHEGKFKVVWDWFVLLLVIFTAIQVPFNASFVRKQRILLDILSVKDIQPMLIITTLVDLMFVLDIFINFRTTFINPSSDTLERKPKKLAINYLKTWFLIDLLSAIPFDWIMYDHSDGGTSSTLIGLLKSARLLRLFRVARRMDRYSEYGIAVLFLLMCLFTLFAHWLACIWNYISVVESDNPNSWIRKIDMALNPSTAAKNSTIGLSLGQRYVASLYFIVSSLTSVGFGNIAATTEMEQGFSVIVMLIGALMYACIFGNMVAIVQRLYSKASAFQENMSTIREFMNLYKISEPLQTSLNNYIRRDCAASKGLETQKVLHNFPEHLQTDLTYELYQNVFIHVKPFRQATVSCSRALSRKFKTITLQANNTIIRQGDEVTRFYIVGKGVLEVLINGHLVFLLTKNSTFGFNIEDDLTRQKSKANIKAERLAEIHYIEKDDLLEILQLYPKFAKAFKQASKHSYDMNDPEEEGYINIPQSKDKDTVGAMAKHALGIPFVTKFNATFRMRSRKTSKLTEMNTLPENQVYKTDSSIKLNGNGTLSHREDQNELLTKHHERVLVDLNQCDNVKPVIKTYEKQPILPTAYEETQSLSSISLNDNYVNKSNRTCKVQENYEMDFVEQRLTSLEMKVESLNRTLDERFHVILKTLNEIRDKNNTRFYEGCDMYLETATTVSSPDYEKENLSWGEIPIDVKRSNTVDKNNDDVDCSVGESDPLLHDKI